LSILVLLHLVAKESARAADSSTNFATVVVSVEGGVDVLLNGTTNWMPAKAGAEIRIGLSVADRGEEPGFGASFKLEPVAGERVDGV
jgi:hypothetical protein